MLCTERSLYTTTSRPRSTVDLKARKPIVIQGSGGLVKLYFSHGFHRAHRFTVVISFAILAVYTDFTLRANYFVVTTLFLSHCSCYDWLAL